MRGRELGWLLLLLAFAASKPSRAARRAPSSPQPFPTLPPDIDVYVEPTTRELLEPPEEPSNDDLLWARYIGDKGHAHPEPHDDTKAVSRKLSRFERWALAPYFPVAEDLQVTLNHGDLLQLIPGARERLEQARKLDPQMVDRALEAYKRFQKGGPGDVQALTAINPATSKVEVFIPRLQPLYTRWWLGVLGHELAHVSQYRMGMTAPQILEALARHGYSDSPIEQQARVVQRQVLRGLTMRARNYFRSKGL